MAIQNVMQRIGKGLLLLAIVIASAFALIYTVDYGMLVFGFSVNQRVASDFIRLAIVTGILVALLFAGNLLLRPVADRAPSLLRRRTCTQRFMVLLALTIPAAVVIWVFWLATEL
jgi:hypothetical protein